jgi:hypothetical protein
MKSEKELTEAKKKHGRNLAKEKVANRRKQQTFAGLTRPTFELELERKLITTIGVNREPMQYAMTHDLAIVDSPLSLDSKALNTMPSGMLRLIANNLCDNAPNVTHEANEPIMRS